METKKVKLFLTLFCFLGSLQFIYAQSVVTKLIKLKNVNHYGVTDTIDLMPILINTNGNIVVSGNRKMSSTQYDAATVSELSTGVTDWINAFNPSNEKAFITASWSDATGFIYNVGAIRTSGSNGTDFLILKLDASGNVIWSQTWDNGLNDGAIAVCVDDSNGDIYVTGATEGAGFIDYATLKIDATGAIIWTAFYDYANTFDIPTAIHIDPGATDLVVTGSSGTSTNDWDFATVIYDANTGSQITVNRTPNTAGASQDKAFGMSTDSQGNIYVLGTTYNATSQYDVQLLKLDTAFNTVFVNTFDGHGFDDAGINLAIDGNDNVYIVGTSYKSATSTEVLVMKYDKNGNLKWTFTRQPQNGTEAEGLRVKLMSDNEIFIGANFGSGSSQDIALLCLDSLGRLNIEKTFDGSGFKDRLMDFAISGSNIYVSARTTTASSATVENNITIHYEYGNFTQNVTTVGSGSSAQSYVNGEVIISFNKSVCDMNNINNKDFTFGLLEDFVADSTCDKIELALDPEHLRGLDAKAMKTRKIFFDLTEPDSLSETRTGNYVKVPEFYTAFVVTLPSIINTANSISPLNSNAVKPDIRYSQFNNISHLASPPPPPTTNDPDFSTAQGALHPISGYSLGHINVDSAWAIITGTSSVRLGIFDSGIQPGHADLPTNISGYDFAANTNLANGDLDNHGTGVAGTAGAIRNNNIGIAGVAGGDASTSQAGVNLYDCRVTSNGFVTDTWVAPAIMKSSQGTNIGGFALHVLNFGFYWAVYYDIKFFGHGVNQLTIDAMNFANRNGVAICAPKANFNNIGTNVFPADWSDEIEMSVGSNGTDGEHCEYGVNCTNASTNWGQIDFVAPGSSELVKTTSSSGAYMIEDGTSYATPHASGVVSLMMGYRNSPNPDWNNLVHEDCEYILQKTTTDCKDSLNYPGEKMGYDSLTGWGRLNAYKALQAINKNYYRIRHISESIGSTSTSGALLNNVFTDTMTWTNYPGVPTGTYLTQIWQRTTIINYTLLPTEQIIDAWPLHKECYGTKFDSTYVDCDRPYYGRIDGVSATACTMTTFYYKIPSLNVHMPYAPSQIKSAFSLYTYDSEGTVGIKENKDLVNYSKFKVFPNPNSGQFEVEFAADFIENLNYKLTNILGQVTVKGEYKSSLGINHLKVSNTDLSNGVYILSIFNKDKELYKQKIIKQ